MTTAACHTLAVGHADGDFARTAIATFAAADASEKLVLAADLAHLDFDPFEILGAGARERLQLIDSSSAYEAFEHGTTAALLRHWEGVLASALAEGYRGLNVVADNTAILTGSAGAAESWLSWEQQTDAWQAGQPVGGTCFVDARRVDAQVLTDVARLHPKISGSPIPAWRLLHDVSGATPHAVLTGEIEAWDADGLAATVAREAALSDRVVIDVSGLRYLHHAALWAARAADVEHRVSLVGAVGPVQRLLTAFDTAAG